MEATALCIRLMLNVLLLQAARAHRSRALRWDAAFPQIFPSRLQFFEYESISFTCEESEWRGVRNTEELIPTCTGGTVTPAVTCTITDVFERDSGGYWCEAEGGQRSNTVNITVTAGSVILESPAPPVMEGDTVVLRCRQKATLVNRTAGFYKDGLRIETGYKGTMTINSVSRSDEGLYKCNISGAGDSPESWLTVIQNDFTQQNQEVSDADVRIVPSRLQLFEYESVSFTCRGFNLSAGWSVRNIKRVIPTCLTSVTCTLNYAFVSDSGEYWCEGAGGERSSTVNITVTGGSVILESPVLPVMEGEAVTLRCRNRATSSNLTADFYKDGLFIGSSSTGNMTIASVSKFDGGLYTCSISGAGESPASRLTVRGGSVILDGPALPVTEGDAVTLRCRNQGTLSELQAEFYKDGLLIRSSSTGEMTIDPFSKSDEGLYKCSISGVGESAQNPLTVTVRISKNNDSVKQGEDPDTQDTDSTASREGIVLHHHYSILLWVVIAVVLVLQLLVIGLLHRKKQLVLLEVQLNDPNKDQHSVVKQDKKKRCKEGKEDKKRKGSFI